MLWWWQQLFSRMYVCKMSKQCLSFTEIQRRLYVTGRCESGARHQVLLENDAVRVLEIRMKQDAKSEMHSHPRSVVYNLNNSQVKFTFPDGKSDVLDLKRGQAMWLDAVSHSVENTGTEDVMAVLVELKK
jgi:quercetin dioxygenase-like cupin family protein